MSREWPEDDPINGHDYPCPSLQTSGNEWRTSSVTKEKQRRPEGRGRGHLPVICPFARGNFIVLVERPSKTILTTHESYETPSKTQTNRRPLTAPTMSEKFLVQNGRLQTSRVTTGGPSPDSGRLLLELLPWGRNPPSDPTFRHSRKDTILRETVQRSLSLEQGNIPRTRYNVSTKGLKGRRPGNSQRASEGLPRSGRRGKV